MGRLCYPTQHPGRVLVPRLRRGQKAVTVQGGYGTCFCRHGTNFIEHYACRGTILIEAGKLSRYRMFIRSTGAVSRYMLSRSQKSIKVQDLYCGQMSVSGCKNHYEFVLSAGAKAKTVTNNLPILSVLCVAFYSIINVLNFGYLTEYFKSISIFSDGFRLSFQVNFPVSLSSNPLDRFKG